MITFFFLRDLERVKEETQRLGFDREFVVLGLRILGCVVVVLDGCLAYGTYLLVR